MSPARNWPGPPAPAKFSPDRTPGRVEAPEVGLDRVDPGDHAPVQPVAVRRPGGSTAGSCRGCRPAPRGTARSALPLRGPHVLGGASPPISVATSSTSSSTPAARSRRRAAAISRRATRGWTTTDTRVSRRPRPRSSGGRRRAPRAGCRSAAGRRRRRPRTSTSETAGRRLRAHRDQPRTGPGDRSPALAAATPRARAAARGSPLGSARASGAAVAVGQVAVEERAGRGGRCARLAGRDRGAFFGSRSSFVLVAPSSAIATARMTGTVFRGPPDSCGSGAVADAVRIVVPFDRCGRASCRTRDRGRVEPARR